MKALIAALALSLPACATTTAEGAPAASSGPCNADGLGALIGRLGTPALGAEAQRLSGARRLRWIRPGDAVTMDYSPDRLNIHLDPSDRVERFACG
jgi:hypothetical protein